MKKAYGLLWDFLPMSVVLAMILLPTPATASGWERLDAIHFNTSEIDFGTVPRRGVVYYEPTDRPTDVGADASNPYAVYELSEDRDEARQIKWNTFYRRMLLVISKKEDTGLWEAARKGYERLGTQWGWTGSVRDRVEVLSRYLGSGSGTQKSLEPHLRRYLHALSLLDSYHMGEAERAFRELSEKSEAGFLQEHAIYQLASAAYQMKQYADAITRYQTQLSLYPHSIKTEAALIMLARASILPAENARDARVGMDAVRTLLNTFPHSRFRPKAIGLAGRYHLLAGHVHQAADCFLQVGDLESAEKARRTMAPAEQGPTCRALFIDYLIRLGQAKTYYPYEQSILALDRLTLRLSIAEAFRISVRIVHDAQVGTAYLYYRIYHCRNKPEEVLRMARLADKIAARSDWKQIAPPVRLRLAETFYQAREYSKALIWTERAAADAITDRVYFVRGAILHKRGRHRAAIAYFNMLLQRFPNSTLRHGAREELAILYEVTGQFPSALKEYFLVGYQRDTAFLLDVRMSIPELETYYRTRANTRTTAWDLDSGWERMREEGLRSGPRPPKYTESDLLAFSIGIRYMRKERWDEARAWFRRVSSAAYTAFIQLRNMDPLKAIAEMEPLQRAIGSARSQPARAKAMFRYATYYYRSSDLLLYNSAAWLGDRCDSLSGEYARDKFTAEDETATRAHMYEHEAYARSLTLCKEVARRYPDSPTAPQALYRAACCAYHLSSFNGWWRSGYTRRPLHPDPGWHTPQKDALLTEASRLMRQIVRRYPKDPLARSARKYGRVFANAAKSEG